MQAKYNKTLYQNGDFSICLFESIDPLPEDKKCKYCNNSSIFTAKGSQLPQVHNLKFDLNGSWDLSNKYGWSFKVVGVTAIVERNKDSVLAYLQSIKGIGKILALRIYNRFGLSSIEILDNDIMRLLEVPGITNTKIKKIRDNLNANQEFQKCYRILSQYGINADLAKKVFDILGENAGELVQKGPYQLCKINISHFGLAEQIAAVLHIKQDSTWRITYAILYTLYLQSRRHGHVCVPYGNLIFETRKALLNSVPQEIIGETIHLMFNEKTLYQQKYNGIQYIYTQELYTAEKQTAVKLAQLITFKNPKLNEIKMCESVLNAQKQMGIVLGKSQNHAVGMAIQYPVCIITGGPGTGKTTLLKVLKNIYEQLYPDLPIVMMAPTGRAARKMAESTGFESAGTLYHTLGLGIDGSDQHSESEKANPENSFPPSIFIIDEFSMVDMKLMYELMRRVTIGSRLVFVGDPAQLPSVGSGNVLHEMIRSKQIPVTTLSTIYRQNNKTSCIVINADRMRHGETTMALDEDFQFIEESNIQKVEEIIVRQYMHEIRDLHTPIDNVQILTPFKKPTIRAATTMFNTNIQKLVNPPNPRKPEIKIGTAVFRVGDKVIQQKNAANKVSEIMNGDIGYISEIAKNPEDNETYIKIDFGFHIASYKVHDMISNDIVLAYAITIHKSQGSEYQTVIMPVVPEHEALLQRNLIYTAITRASEKVILVGQMRTLKEAIKQNTVSARNTMLAARLGIYVPKAITSATKQNPIMAI